MLLKCDIMLYDTENMSILWERFYTWTKSVGKYIDAQQNRLLHWNKIYVEWFYNTHPVDDFRFENIMMTHKCVTGIGKYTPTLIYETLNITWLATISFLTIVSDFRLDLLKIYAMSWLCNFVKYGSASITVQTPLQFKPFWFSRLPVANFPDSSLWP